MGLDGGSGSRLPAAGQELAVTPPMVAAQVAMPAADDYKRADSIAGAIPDALRDLASKGQIWSTSHVCRSMSSA